MLRRILTGFVAVTLGVASHAANSQSTPGWWVVEMPYRGCILEGELALKLVVIVGADGKLTSNQGSLSFREIKQYPPPAPPPNCNANGQMYPYGLKGFVIATDTNPPNVPAIKSFDPAGRLEIASPGQCGLTAAEQGDITATITPTSVTVRCGERTVSGTPRPAVSFRRVR